MYDIEKLSAVLENTAGFVRRDAHIYSHVTKINGSIGMFIHWGNKLCVPPNAV